MAVCAAAASGCVIGPKYVPPQASVPSDYKEASPTAAAGSWKPAEPRDEHVRGSWWAGFSDPQLDALEGRVNVTNQTVAAAAAGLQAARALVRQARSQYMPTVTLNPSVTSSRVSTGFGRTLGSSFISYVLPVEASWEPDVWGRVRQTVASSRFAAQVSAADLENVRLSMQAELAADYCQLRTQDALAEVFEAAVRAYEDALDLTRARFTAGIENDEAVAQQEAQLTATRAQATNLLLARAQYEHAIAVLVGEPPATFSIAVDPRPLPLPMVPAGFPSELLERRPDIAAAERAVAQANAQIGLAQTAFFPAVLLSATGGFESTSLATWLSWPSRIWSVGPSLVQAIFDGGLRRATVQQYRAVYEGTVADYRQTVLTAFQEVEDNLAALRILTQVIDEQNAAVAAADRALAVADVRYRGGLDPYLNVIVAQAALRNAQEALVAFRGQQLVAAVQLIRALGGGWNVSDLPSD
jgi:NodT family efflux transporter outer membrane factor (OMF) lipoprotein